MQKSKKMIPKITKLHESMDKYIIHQQIHKSIAVGDVGGRGPPATEVADGVAIDHGRRRQRRPAQILAMLSRGTGTTSELQTMCASRPAWPPAMLAREAADAAPDRCRRRRRCGRLPCSCRGQAGLRLLRARAPRAAASRGPTTPPRSRTGGRGRKGLRHQ
jgi:hypothetical protein